MPITIKNVIPDFLEKEKIDNSEVWNKEVTINDGSKLQIIAPSGRGKSSFIHFLYGLRNDFKGSIQINGNEVKNFTAADFAPLRQKVISIIFQDLRLFPDHTVLENIEIKRVLQPFHPKSRIREMAERLGIETKLSQLCRHCSYGEQQRVAIIRALQQPFDFLIMDEPFSHLDESNRQKAMALVEEEAALRNAGIILADLKDIEYFNTDSILYL